MTALPPGWARTTCTVRGWQEIPDDLTPDRTPLSRDFTCPSCGVTMHRLNATRLAGDPRVRVRVPFHYIPEATP